MLSVLEGRDTLAVMPTGSGKSAIYQAPALILPGPTVVVSPLIALQQDQMEGLESREVAPAVAVNSVMPISEQREAFADLRRDLEFLFLAPEQFNKTETVERVKSARPSLFVVDEAHCISEWGHDFRPDYLRLGAVIEALGHPTVLALTATANPAVREEIVQRLGMRHARLIVRGFDRPNIWLGVRQFPTGDAKREALLAEVADAERPGIVYAASRRHAEEIASELNERGIAALCYHGGMPGKEREPVQDDFMRGNCDVMVATSAFGMGVDKPDVRFVFHFDAADSLDSYYQEIGRAGRDGGRARAILFYRPEDLHLHRFLKSGGKPKADEIERIAEAVSDHQGPMRPEDLRKETGLSKLKLARAVTRLEEAGVVEKAATGEILATGRAVDVERVSAEGAAEQERRHQYELLRIEKMKAYAELLGCRREYLMHHFGEDFPANCGNCDNCQSPRSDPRLHPQRRRGRRFPLKSRVVHKEWGKGIVEEHEDGKIVVLFDEAGRKTLSLEAVLKNDLLEPAG